jgi:hypothetical protein
MRFTPRPGIRRRPVIATAAVVLAAALGAVATAGAVGSAPSRDHHHAQSARSVTAKQLAFHDAMRKLWEDHITWTRLTIVSFAGGLPDLPATRRACSATRPTSATRSSPTTARPPATA